MHAYCDGKAMDNKTYMYIYIYTYIYIYDSGSRLDSPPLPPMVWVSRTRALDPDSRAICSISKLQFPICTLFAPLQSPNPPICALYAPLRRPTFSTYNLYGSFTSLETIYIIYIYINIYIYNIYIYNIYI